MARPHLVGGLELCLEGLMEQSIVQIGHITLLLFEFVEQDVVPDCEQCGVGKLTPRNLFQIRVTGTGY